MVPTLRPDGSQEISPTAHYTGYIWARNGLSPPELASLEERVRFESLLPSMILSGLLGVGRSRLRLRDRSHSAAQAVNR